MLPLRQIFRKVSAKLINRILDYVLGPIPRATAPAAREQGEHRKPRSDKPAPQRATPAPTAELPLANGKPALRPLDHNIEHEGTVWIPRGLWALAWADLNNAGGRTASDLTKILEEQAGLAVRANNFARAFRDLKTDSRARGLWTVEDKRFTITAEGKALLHEIIG